MAWMLRLVQTGAEGEGPCMDVMEIDRPGDLGDIASLGLTLAEAKRLLAGVQQEFVAAQAREHAVRRPDCSRCGGVCRVKDYRDHAVATLFGQVTMRLPRFRCAACSGIEAGISWPSHCRSTPELDRLQAHLCALLSYRTAAEVLAQLFPVGAGKHHETFRRHALKVGEALGGCAAVRLEAAASAITVTLDSTFIRSCADDVRHLEVRVGNVETEAGGRQVFGAVAKAGTDVRALIRRSLDAVGRTKDTALTAFTDGCPGLRRILADAGVAGPPILDWFHTAMRLQHLKQIASALPADDPARGEAKAVIVKEVSGCTGASGMARPWMPRSASIAFARSRTISRASRSNERPTRHYGSCGPPCRHWTGISPAKAPGWSTTPSGTARACGLAPRSPRARPTSW